MPVASDTESTGSIPSRTLLLWLAALAVTWVSGIEPTWRKIQDVAARFERVNWQRQEADLQAAAQLQLIEVERAWLPRLQEFEAKYPGQEGRDRARKALYQTLQKWQTAVHQESQTVSAAASESQSKGTADACASPLLVGAAPVPRGETEAQKKLASAIDLLRNFCQLELGLDQMSPDKQKLRVDKQTEIIRTGEEAHQKALAEARTDAEKARENADVDFELLGLKFKAAPLLASLLWSAFAFAWLQAARREATKARTPSGFTSGAATQGEDRNVALLALMLLAWAVQLRVSWVGLGVTALQGAMRWKALLAIALYILSLGSGWVVAQMLANRQFSDASPAAYATGSRKLVLGLVLLSASVFAVVWCFPGPSLRLTQSLKPSVTAIGALPLLLVAWSSLRSLSNTGTTPGLSSRRGFMKGTAGAAAVALAGLVWLGMQPPAHSRQGASRWARLWKRHERVVRTVSQTNTLKAGFYLRATTPSVASASSTTVHYVGEGGRITTEARLPELKTLVQTHQPFYRWLRSPSQSQNPSWLVEHSPARTLNDEREELGKYRVAYATASWSFEHAAVGLLTKRGTGRVTIQRACELLLNGILHDVMFKRTHGHLRKRSAPSYRLYDLAAGLAVRFNQPHVLQELKLRIEQAGYGLIFESRVRKWEDPNSGWHRRWRDRRFPMRWQCDQGVAVF